VKNKKIKLPDASTPVKFLLNYQNKFLITVTTKHIYMIRISGNDNEILSKISLTINSACFCFLSNSKLYVGGNFIEVFDVRQFPIPRKEIIKK
jgi:hypothetical protein